MKKITPPASETFARIRVIGVGGSGKNVVNHMIKSGLSEVDFIVANTDSQDLKQSKAGEKIHLGQKLTGGLGTGMDPSLGRNAAEESAKEITEELKGADLVFIACGMGGGTGTGASPVIAKLAKDLGILTVAVVTKPFTFEGGKRKKIAEEGIAEMMKIIDSLVVIPNDNILKNVSEKTSMAEAFSLSDDVLLQAVSSISRLLLRPGEINIDFADLKTIMKDSGSALLGVGKAKGTNRAEIAVSQALASPLLDSSVKGAGRILFSIVSRTKTDISMMEIQKIAERITESVNPEAKIIFGTSIDKDLKQGEIAVTLIATGLEEEDSAVKQVRESNTFSSPPAPFLVNQHMPDPPSNSRPERQDMETAENELYEENDSTPEEDDEGGPSTGWRVWNRT